MQPIHRPWARPWLVMIDSDTDGGGQSTDVDDAAESSGDAAENDQKPQPKPTETVEYWKRRARDNEQRAKMNADAAKRLQDIEDRDKTEQQRAADALAKAQREAAEAQAETVRYKAAATHGITGDDIDLIGSGDEETVMARAERLGQLLAESRELAALREQTNHTRAPSGRPVPNLRPGATPVDVDVKPSQMDEVAQLVAARGWATGTSK